MAGLALTWLVPPAAVRVGHPGARLLGLATWVAASASYLPTLRRFGLSPFWAPLLPAVAVFYIAATLGSAVDQARGRGVVWKRRAYGADRLREAGA